MKRIVKISIIISIISCTISCSSPKKKRSVNIPYVDYNTEYVSQSETINVPFNIENGVKYITVKINGLSTDMIFDSGCSETLISTLEAQQLLKRGLLTEEDFLGVSKSVIADGSIVEDAIFNLRTLEITDGNQVIVCHNVLTQVSSNTEAPVLLGNGVLDRVASYTIDNEEKVVRFKLK